MTYNSKLPMDDEYIAAGPADIRENFRALKEDQIVDAGKLAGLAVGNANGNIPVSNGTVNAKLNADLLDGYEANAFALTSHTHASATTSTDGMMRATDKTKLDGIATGAQVNQNAFSNVAVGGTTIQADSATDTLSLVAGANITISPDATNDAVTIAISGTVPSATTATTCSGNAATATKLATARTLNFTGDASGSTTFDGSANASASLNLTNSGVAAGTYRTVTVDAKGRVTAGANPATEDINITGNAATATSCGGVGTIAVDISNSDLNLVTRPTGFYRGAAMTNAPNTGWFYVVHIAHNLGSYIYQEAISYGSSNTANLVYTRCLVNGVWTAWSQMAHISDIAANAINWNSTSTFTVGKQNTVAPQTFQIWNSTVIAPATPAAFPFIADVVDSPGSFSNSPSKNNYRTIYSQVGDVIPEGTYSLASIVQALVDRSHRHVTHSAQGVSNCNCNCDGSSCFVAGTLVLMDDGTWKEIQEVEVGEKVLGLNGVNTVQALWETTVGNRRSVWTFPEQDIYFSGEHLFWIKKPTGEEWFGTHDYTQYLLEKRYHSYPVDGKQVKYVGLFKSDPYVITEPVEYAHITGFVKQAALVCRDFGVETKLYNLVVDGSHTFIANGYVVSGEVRDDDYDYSNNTWKGIGGE